MSDSDIPDYSDMVADGEEETKDRCKNNKFLKMLRAGQLPEFLVAEWQRVKGSKWADLKPKEPLSTQQLTARPMGVYASTSRNACSLI